MGDVVDATEDALRAARHLTDMDAAAVEALRALAAKIDANASTNDNVSFPTFLRYCDSLGLTPTGRKALELKEEARGKLAAVRDLRAAPAPSKKRAN